MSFLLSIFQNRLLAQGTPEEAPGLRGQARQSKSGLDDCGTSGGTTFEDKGQRTPDGG